MIDLTPLLDRLDAQDVPYQDDTVTVLEEKFANLDAIMNALVEYLGLDWCVDCADVHQPDSHVVGKNMGTPGFNDLPDAPLMGP